MNNYASANEGSNAISGLIAYTSREDSRIYTIDYDNSFTTEVLYRLAGSLRQGNILYTSPFHIRNSCQNINTTDIMEIPSSNISYI